jgi:hypothetical protein
VIKVSASGGSTLTSRLATSKLPQIQIFPAAQSFPRKWPVTLKPSLKQALKQALKHALNNSIDCV